MHLLKIFRPEDVDSNAPPADYSTFRPRPAVRVVIFDGAKVALIFVRAHGYYMLPGGGIDDIEDQTAALTRETKEELGCEISITSEVGSVTIYNDRWKTKQTDSCYIAQLLSASMDISHTDFEKEEGHELVWANTISEAIQLVQRAVPENRDGKLVRVRDLLFLETVQKLQK